MSIMKRTFVSNLPLRAPSRPLRDSLRWSGDRTAAPTVISRCQHQRRHASDHKATRPKTALFFPGLRETPSSLTQRAPPKRLTDG